MKNATKIFLLLLAVGARIVCVSQPGPIDTICFPVPVAQKIMIAAEQKKVLEERVVFLNDDIDLLNKRITEKEKIIFDLKTKDINNAEIIGTYERELSIMKEQRKTFEDEIKIYKKQLKKEKRRRFWTAAGGMAGMGILAVLYITK